jgi:hypothetical protein
VRPIIGFVGRHDLAIRRLPMNFGVKVGEGGSQRKIEGPRSGLIGSHIWLGRMVDEIIGEKFLEQLEIATSCTSSVLRRTTLLAISLIELLRIGHSPHIRLW